MIVWMKHAWSRVLRLAMGLFSAASLWAQSSPVISEFLASNQSSLRDLDGDASDWIEIHNPGPTAVDLAGWQLTDDSAELAKWRFPSVTVPGRGYLVVFASGKNRASAGQELHTNFRLDAAGEYLALVRPDARTIASEFKPRFPAQSSDISYGLMGGAFFYFQNPTPGAANEAGRLGITATPILSHARGFYERPFELTMQTETPGAVVRFTTNGLAPSATSGLVYTAPLRISGTTVLKTGAFKENFLPSPVETHSFIFTPDVIRQSPDGSPPPGWPASWGTNVVDYGMDPEIVNATPYRGIMEDALKSLPTFSLVMNLNDLFDARTGIYANARRDGREWERPCSVELIHPGGAEGFQINAGLRIRGGFSRLPGNPKHAFRLFFRQAYGAAKLRYPLFGEEGADEFDAIDLRTFQNYSWSFFGDPRGVFVRDQVARDTQLALGQPAKRGRFYHLYLNGQYWGLYNTDERSEASYAASYFGGRKEDYDVIKVEPFVYQIEATDGNLDAWTRLYHMARAGFGSDAAYQRVQGNHPDGIPHAGYETLLDLPNLIDYMLVIFYGGDLDAPASWFLGNNLPNNFYAVRSRAGRAGFRFFVHDAEHTLLNVLENRTGPFLAGEGSVLQSNPQWLFQRLQEHPDFRLLVADRAHRHFFHGGVLTTQSMTARFLKRIQEIDRAVVGESARWGDAQRARPLTRDVEWTNAVAEIVREYLPRRSEIVLNQLRQKELYPLVPAPIFNVQGGAVDAGFQLSMRAALGGIYYTLDGSDPRLAGGEIAPTAKIYESPIRLSSSREAKARALQNGVWSALNVAAFFVRANLSGLVISEIMYHPADNEDAGGGSAEFIELMNTGSGELDLSGVHFSQGIQFRFPLGARAFPGEFLVLVRNPERFAQAYPAAPIHGVYSGALSNGGESLALSHPDGTTILSFAYSDGPPWPAEPDGTGPSLVFALPELRRDPGDPAHWRRSERMGGTPGTADVPDHPVWINEVLPRPAPMGLPALELHNPNPAALDLQGWFLSDSRAEPKKLRLPPESVIPPAGFLLFTEGQFGSSFRLEPKGGELFLFSADGQGNLTGFSDRFRYTASDEDVSFGRFRSGAEEILFPALSRPTLGTVNSGPRVGPVIISELFPGAAAGATEFIELKNISNEPVNFFNLRSPSLTWRLAGVEFDLPPGAQIDPGDHLLVVPIAPEVFRARNGVPSSIQVLGPYAGSLDSDGETVQLLRPETPLAPSNSQAVNYVIVDEVRYRTRRPWPELAANPHRSLERLDPPRYGNEPSAWRASPVEPSPGQDNEHNRTPRVRAGGVLPFLADSFPFLVQLEGTVEDDGSPQGTPMVQWILRSGPGPVAFGNFRSARTTASFPKPGGYVLRLSADDGDLGAFDDLRVAITSPVLARGSDFNSDGHSDLLFQHQDGTIAVWLMEGLALKSGGLFHPSTLGEANWQLAGAGDFNQDGQADLLFQHARGSLSAWLMKGTSLRVSGQLNPPSPDDPNWRVAALADFNRDGRVDLLFQHANGNLVVWLMNGVLFTESRFPIPSHPGDGRWRVAGSGDFNSDGNADILFQHEDGALAVWNLDGVQLRSAAFLTPRTPSEAAWRVAAVADLNRDGHADLLFQHSRLGTLAAWLMEGSVLQRAELLNPSNPGTGWQVAGP